jgi:hypothetical protein
MLEKITGVLGQPFCGSILLPTRQDGCLVVGEVMGKINLSEYLTILG